MQFLASCMHVFTVLFVSFESKFTVYCYDKLVFPKLDELTDLVLKDFNVLCAT